MSKFTKKDYDELAIFIAKKSKDVTNPFNFKELCSEYKEESSTPHSEGFLMNKLRVIRLQVFNWEEFPTDLEDFDNDTKVKMLFGLSAPVDYEFLDELKKEADVEVDHHNRITKYEKKGEGGLQLNGVHSLQAPRFPNESCKRILKFLAEISQNRKFPIEYDDFAKEFERSTNSKLHECERNNYNFIKQYIHMSTEYGIPTRIKMLFVSGARVNTFFLGMLRKDAIVEVDDKGKITKYEANDHSLTLNISQNSTEKNEKEQQDENEIGFTDKDYDELAIFIAKKSKDVTNPFNFKELCSEFKRESGTPHSKNELMIRVREIRLIIFEWETFPTELEVFDNDTKVKMLFALRAPVDYSILAKLREDAVVEVDKYLRITKYEKKGEDGFQLRTAHSSLPPRYPFDEEDRRAMQFLAKISQNRTSPIAYEDFAKEFKKWKNDDNYGEANWYFIKLYIHIATDFDMPTRVKMLFVSGARVNTFFLGMLRKDAIVEVDDKGKITKYEANDHSLTLNISQNSTEENEEEQQDENEIEFTNKDYDDFVNFIAEKSKNVNAPFNFKELCSEFKRESGTPHSKSALLKRFRKLHLNIYEWDEFAADLEDFEKLTKYKILFAFRAPVDNHSPAKLREDAVVEVDRYLRVTKCEKKGEDGFELRAVVSLHAPRYPFESDKEAMQLLAEMSKNTKSPINYEDFAKQFDRSTENWLGEDIKNNCYEFMEDSFEIAPEFDMPARQRTLHVSGADVKTAVFTLTAIADDDEEENDTSEEVEFTDKDYDDFAHFIAEKSKKVTAPFNLRELSREFKKESGKSHSENDMREQAQLLRLVIFRWEEFDTDTKVKMLFALSAPVDYSFLAKLREEADVEVDKHLRITKYEKKGEDGFQLSGVHVPKTHLFPNSTERKMLKVLAEISQSRKSPIEYDDFAKEFERSTDSELDEDDDYNIYEYVKGYIHIATEYDMQTRIKMLFISEAEVNTFFLEMLRKDAIVDVDKEGKITKYKANDDSLTLNNKQNSTEENNVEQKNENEIGIFEKDLDDFVNFIAKKSKNVTAPFNLKKLCADFKKESSKPHSKNFLMEKLREICLLVFRWEELDGDLEEFDNETKAKMLFGLSAPVDYGFLERLREDAVVEVDKYLRITKYEKKGEDGFQLNGVHISHAPQFRDYIDTEMMKFLAEMSQNRKSPIKYDELAKDFERSTGFKLNDDDENHCYEFIKKYIYIATDYDIPTRIRMLFVSRAVVNPFFLKMLQNDAIVEVDEEGVITKYEANDHSLMLNINQNSTEENPEEEEDESELEITDKEDDDLVKFIAEKSKNVTAPFNLEELCSEYRRESGFPYSENVLRSRLREIRLEIFMWERLETDLENFDTDTKVKMMFGLSAPVDYEFLEMLREEADVEVDKYLRITKYEKKEEGGLRLNGVHRSRAPRFPCFEDRKLLKLLAKISQSRNSPMTDEDFLNEYAASCYSTRSKSFLESSYTFIKKYLHMATEFDIPTRIKMLFVSEAEVNTFFLGMLRKDAIVDVDEYGAITRYEAHDGSLTLDINQNSTEENTEEDEDESELDFTDWDVDDFVEFVARESEDVTEPFNLEELCSEFKEGSGKPHSESQLMEELLRIRLFIFDWEFMSNDTKAKSLFALSAPVDYGFLAELREEADVEVDKYNRITKYEKKGEDGFQLSGVHGSLAPRYPCKSDRDAMQVLAEISQNRKSPIQFDEFAKEFEKSSGYELGEEEYYTSYDFIKEYIHMSTEYDMPNRVKMLFVLGAEVNTYFLGMLRKDAIVDVDEKGVITRYEAHNGSLTLGESQNESEESEESDESEESEESDESDENDEEQQDEDKKPSEAQVESEKKKDEETLVSDYSVAKSSSGSVSPSKIEDEENNTLPKTSSDVAEITPQKKI